MRPFYNPLAGTGILQCVAIIGVLIAGCNSETPTAVRTHEFAPHFNYNAAAGEDKGYLTGWLNGEAVSLHYTKSFFCAEPPASAAPTHCVLGADAEVEPRPGPLPILYAIAAAGFRPDPATLACQAGTACLNHPAMIDASRVGGPPGASGIPHSHIVTEQRGGWFRTVNVRVFDVNVWNQIAAAKSLAKVRELQADPAVGGAGKISQDTPTNIFFFLQVQPEKP